MSDIDQFLFFYFDGVPIFISAFIDLFAFDFKSGEYWLIVIFGLATGITIANYINGKWKPHPVGILLLIFLPANFFIFQVSSTNDAKTKYIEIESSFREKSDYYYRLNKTKKDKVNKSSWMVQYKKDEARRNFFRGYIIKSLSLQFLFTFFSVFSFIFIVFNFNPTIKKYRDKVEAKREKEKARKTFNERIEKNKDQPTQVKASTNEEVLEWIHKERVKKDPDYAREVEEEAQDIKDCVERWIKDL